MKIDIELLIADLTQKLRRGHELAHVQPIHGFGGKRGLTGV